MHYISLLLESGTLFRILSGTRPSVQTVSDVCLKRIRLLKWLNASDLSVPLIHA